ncbi:MAG: SPOR domain-containing protein [Ignavibacteriae bacterium]|nr:SPOR domain-containing protein [Ignavibacteria bacterium]MBI3363978.1 SPOR domain-containing protein [Ignavibacteriota bacterium]
MKQIGSVILTVVIILSVLVAGCSSSKQASNDTQQQSSTPPSASQQPETRHDRVDTLDVKTQNTEKPAYQSPVAPAPSSSSSPAASPGTFTVQVGAYKSQDGADRIAQLAKERFGRGVTVLYDAVGNLYKVMIGTFLTKDDARSFRDDMVRKYSTDYKDAWVSEHPQK